jgi:hypothetical protein
MFQRYTDLSKHEGHRLESFWLCEDCGPEDLLRQEKDLNLDEVEYLEESSTGYCSNQDCDTEPNE